MKAHHFAQVGCLLYTFWRVYLRVSDQLVDEDLLNHATFLNLGQLKKALSEESQM